nr:MAG TPA: hypothetical protein [Caudoviricetes sp.]
MIILIVSIADFTSYICASVARLVCKNRISFFCIKI